MTKGSTAIGGRAVGAGGGHRGTVTVPETAIACPAATGIDAAAVLVAIIVAIGSAELLTVVVQKSVAHVICSVSAGVSAVVAQQQTILVSL